jgi:hypothetical protein
VYEEVKAHVEQLHDGIGNDDVGRDFHPAERIIGAFQQ